MASALITSMIGGTISELTGGKFRNGARSAAIVHLFNSIYHDADKSYKSRSKSGKPFWSLGDGFEASLDVFEDSGQAKHEFHVYKNGKEVGMFKEGEFFNKHGKPAISPKGFDQSHLNKLRGLDIDMLRRQGRLPKKGFGRIKGNYSRLIKSVPYVGTGIVVGQLLFDDSYTLKDVYTEYLDSVGILGAGPDSTLYPEGWYIPDVGGRK